MVSKFSIPLISKTILPEKKSTFLDILKITHAKILPYIEKSLIDFMKSPNDLQPIIKCCDYISA